MNLGELIVELSLDSAQFTQELDAAKKRASEAAKAMENIFSKGFEIGIDDSALHDLNKHLDLKIKHLNEVNKYFKNNPVTVHVDDDQLTELNKTLDNLTKKKHVIEIEQRVKNIVQEDDLEDAVKKSVEKGVKEGVKEGVKDGFSEVDKIIEDVVREAVEAGVRSAKSSGGSSSSSSGGFEDIAEQIKAGFAESKDGSDRDYVSRAIEVVLKPGQDLLAGFFEGFSNTFGTEISKSFVQTLGKTMNLNLSKAGEGLGVAFSKVMGVNVDKYKKESQKNQQLQISNTTVDAQGIEKAVYKGVYTASMMSNNMQIATNLLFKTASPLVSKILANVNRETTQKTITSPEVFITPPSKDIQSLSPQVLITPPPKDSQSTPPQVLITPPPKDSALPDLSKIKRNNDLELILETELPKETPKALKLGIESAITSSKQIYKHFDEIKKNSQSTGKDSQQNTRSVADMVEEAKKLRAANSNYVKTMRNLIQSFTDLGEYNTVLKLGKDFGRSKQDTKTIVDKLKADAKAAGATPDQINAIGQALTPITQGEKAISKDVTKLVTTTYGKKQAKILNEVPLMGQDVVSGLFKGLDGVEGIGEKTAEKFIKAFKAELGIRSPSLLMVEMGLMVVSGLALGLQKGDSKIAKGARKVVETLTNTLKPIKEIADPVLGAAGAIPALSSAATYGSAALNVTDTGLKILTKVGERHEEGIHRYATADQTLFHAIAGSIKDLVTGIASDETLNIPREAFDHVINIAKAGALGLGVSPSDMTSFDAAQAGATALLRNSAIMKAIVQSHQQTRAKKDADPSINYLATFKDVLIDNLKGLKLSKGEVLKAFGSAMKVVPTGIGTAAEGNFGIAGEVFSNAPDALAPVLDVYRKAKARKSEGESTKEAVASSLTELGLPSPVAGAIGSAANKLNPQLKGFVAVGKNINEGISKGVLNTVSLTTTAIEFTGNAIQKQIKENMRISSPSRVMMVIGTFIGKGLMIGLQQSIQANGVVKDLVAELTDDLSQDVPNIPKYKRTKSRKSRKSSKQSERVEIPQNVTLLGGELVSTRAGASSGKGFDFSDFLKTIFSKINIKDPIGSLMAIASSLISGFIKGFLGQKGKIDGVSVVFQGLINKIKSILKIKSPSEETKAIGLDFGKGFQDGAIASLAIAIHKISLQYKKLLKQLPEQERKKYNASEIDKRLVEYAADYRKGLFTKETALLTLEGIEQVALSTKNYAKSLVNQQKLVDSYKRTKSYQSPKQGERAGASEKVTLLGGELVSKRVNTSSNKDFDFGDFLKTIFSKINIKDPIGSLMAIASSLISGFIKGFLGQKGKIDGVSVVFQGLINKIKSILKIKSPSKEAESIGLSFGEGFKNGAIASLTAATKIIGKIFNDFLDPLKSDTALPLGEFLRKGFNNVFANLTKQFAPNASLMGGVSRLLLNIFPSLMKPEGLGSMFGNMLPLVGTFMGGRGKVIGDWFSRILVNNNVIKPGFANNLIKSITGINLGTTGEGLIGSLINSVLKDTKGMGGITRLLFASAGLPAILGGGVGVALPRFGIINALNPIISRVTKLTGGIEGVAGTDESKRRGTVKEVVERQIGVNVASTGLGQEANIEDLSRQILGTFYDSLTRESKNSPLMKKIIANVRNVFVDGIAKSDFLSGLGQGSIGSRIFGALNAYASGNVEGAIKSASRLIRLGLRGLKIDKILLDLGIKINMGQIRNVMTAVLLGVSAFHRAFAEEGLNMGNAIAKGFKEAKNNIVNAVGDVQRGIDRELGKDDPQKIWQQIVTRWKQGVVSKDVFKDFWDSVGNKFKRSALKEVDPEDRDSMGENVLSFVASAAAVFAPITTFATSLMPLVAPLIPVFGAIGGAVFMVRKGLQGMIQEMLVIEPMQRKLSFLTGSRAGGDREMQYSIDVSKKLSVSAKSAANAYGSLAVAAKGTALEGEGVKQLFEGINASISALGLSGQDAELIFMAYTQMLSKGKISMEELRQQLGERFPPTMQVFAKAIGKTVPELVDLASKGALLSEEVFPKVAKQLLLEYGGATNGADGLSLALTRLGTVGFEMSVKLTNAYSGLFAGIVNIFTSMAEVVNRNLDNILMFVNSFIIGTAAVLGVGIAMIMKMSFAGVWIKNISTLLSTGIAAAMAGLGPHFLGIFADIADDWFGAQYSIMENMYNGVSNMVISLITLVDNTKRHFSGAGLFDVIMGDTKDNSFNIIKSGIQAISNIFNNFFGFLKPGMVEIVALVLMFEQSQTLFKMLLGPTIKDVRTGLFQVGESFKNMINTALRPSGISSLFTNLTAARQTSLNKDYKAENVSVLKEALNGVTALTTKALEAFKNFTNFLLSPFQSALNFVSRGLSFVGVNIKGLLTGSLNLKQAFINIGQGLQAFSVSALGGFKNVVQFFMVELIPSLIIGTKNATRPLTALFSPDANLRRAVRQDWANLFTLIGNAAMGKIGLALKHLGTLALEFGLALGVMFFARSDFSNPMETAVNKASKGINASLLSIENSFIRMNKTMEKSGQQAANTGKQIKSLADSIPSKGLQLDIGYVFGMKDQGYTTDDLAKRINKTLAGESKPEDLNFFEQFVYYNTRNDNKIRQQNKQSDSNPIWSFLTNPWNSEKKNYNNLELNKQQLDIINKYKNLQSLIRPTDSILPKGTGDLLNSIALADSNTKSFQKSLTKLGLLDQAKYAKTMQETVSKVADIDRRRLVLMMESNRIAEQDPSSEKGIKRRGEIAKELRSLTDQRKKVSKPVDEHMKEISNMQKQLDDLKKTDLSAYPVFIQDIFKSIIQEQEKLLNQAKKVVKEVIPEDVFDSIFQATVGALKRLEQVFERFNKTVESASAKRQYLIYSNVNTPGDVDFASKQSAIIEAEDRLIGASAQYEAQDKAFRMLSLVPESNQSDATKTQIEETRKNRLQAEVELNNAKGNLAKSRYDLNRSIIEQNRQIEEFIRNAEKETIGVKNEFEKASLDLKAMRMKTRISESLAGVVDDGVVSFINSVVSIFEQVNNAVKQQMDAEARIAELGFRRQEIELENAKFRESLPSTDLMDLLVKTRGDIRQLTTAFTEENKKFDDIGNKIIKQGQNLASGLGLANTQAKEIYRQFANMLASTESLNSSTKQFKDNLEGARKAAEETSKILKNFNGTTSGDNGAKPVASNMSDANKDSKLLAQNVNSLTSPLTSISSAVLQMRNNFRDSATYAAQIKDNVNNTNTKDGKPSTLPGNTKLPMPTASNNNENQYAINYGLGNLMASAGVSDIGGLLPSPTLLARGRETREERARRLFKIYLKKDENRVYEKTAGHAFSVLPILQRDMPNIGNILLGEDYRRLSPEDQAFRRIGLIRSATKSDLLAISNTRHLLAIQKTINDLAAVPQTPRTIKALNELTHARYLAQLNINEPYNDNGQDEPFRQKIGFEKLLQIPEFKSNNDRYHNEYLTEFKRYVRRGEENPVFGAQRKLAIAEGYEASTKERNWFDKFLGAFDPRRKGFRELYLLQREAKQYGAPTPVPITSETSNLPSATSNLPSALPPIPKTPPGLVIPTTPVQPTGAGTGVGVNTAGVPGAIETRQEIPNIQESTAVTQAAQSIEAIMQALNNAKTEIEKRRNDLSISSTNQGGVSDVIDQARKDARALLQRFSANPETVIQSDYSENIASINKAIARAKINVNTSNNKLKALETFLKEGLPALFAPVNQLINKLPDGEQKNNLLALLNQYKQQQTDVTTQIIAQAKLDIAEAQITYDELLKEKKALEEGAKKIQVSAQTKLDAERKQQVRDFLTKENNAEIQRLESSPTYQFDAKAQQKVAELKYQNAWMQALTDREKETIGLLEKGLTDPVFREGTQGYRDALQQIENTFKNTMLAAGNNRQTALYNAVTAELGKVTKDKLLASISAPNQYRDSLLDIEQFRQDKIKELTASPFFALREQKDEKNQPTQEAVKQLNEFNKAIADLTIEVERRTDDLKLKEKDRVANLLNEAKITRLEAVKSRGGEVFTINADIRRMKEEEAQRRFNERVRNIPKPSTGEEAEKYEQEMQAARQTYENELENIRRSFETLGEAIKNTAITTGLQTLKDGLNELVTNDLIIGFDGATGKTRDLSNELRGFERVLYNVTKAVLSAITKIVIDAAVNKLFGKDGWLDLTKIFGAAQGGVVPNYAEGGAIGKAMQKERSQNGGINPVLAVLTPGERVLTVDQNRKFEALQLQRFLTPSAVGPEELAYRKIKNYAMGGVVGMDSSLQISNTYSKDQSNTSTTINVPVTVENTGNSNNSQLDANSLQNAVRSAVLTEIQRQQRIGGILRK